VKYGVYNGPVLFLAGANSNYILPQDGLDQTAIPEFWRLRKLQMRTLGASRKSKRF
jgi:hypothetical protein